MKPKYEYRHENHGDQWQEFLGNTWSIEDVAHTVAEEYWDQGDGDCDANDFNLIVEVRAVDDPGRVFKYNVTADYDVRFFPRLQKEVEDD